MFIGNLGRWGRAPLSCSNTLQFSQMSPRVPYIDTIPARSVVVHFWRFFGRFGADTGVFLGALFCTMVGVICYLLLERPLMRAFHNWYKPIPLHKKPAPLST